MLFLCLLTLIVGTLIVALLYRSRLHIVAVAISAVMGAVLGWYVLSVNVENILFYVYASHHDPFAPAEEILTETYNGFRVRYLLETYGWVFGVLYFLMLWTIAYFLKVKKIKH